jgi:HEAT repeat protein
MPVTMEQVRGKLEPIEPDYTEASKLGPDAMPFLEQLANSGDLIFAPRAVYLASLIGGDKAVRILLSAARSPVTIIRVQAAAAARNLPKEKTEDILLKALDDSDFGVRNVALKSIKALSPTAAMSEAIQKKITALSKSDPEQFIRESSNDLLKHSPLK